MSINTASSEACVSQNQTLTKKGCELSSTEGKLDVVSAWRCLDSWFYQLAVCRPEDFHDCACEEMGVIGIGWDGAGSAMARVSFSCLGSSTEKTLSIPSTPKMS